MSSTVATPVTARPHTPFLDVSWRGAWRYWHRNTVVFRRVWLIGMMAWFAEPVIYLLAMGFGLGAYLQEVQGMRYLDFIAPGLVAVSVMFGATFESTWNAFFKMDRQRTYDAASATPLSVEDVALGETLWATTRACIYGGAFIVVVTAAGLMQSWWSLLMIPALIPAGLAFSLFGLIYTYFIPKIDYLAYYWTLILTPMFMFGGVFFPLDRLPTWIQTLAWFMPLHHATNIMRELMVGGNLRVVAGATLWLVVVSALLLWIPPVLLRRRLVR